MSRQQVNDQLTTVNDFWKKKIRFYFNEVLDVDNDGKVNSKDIDIFKEMFRQMKSLDHNSPKLVKFSDFLNKWLEAVMTADQKFGNNDGSISVEEFLRYCENLRHQLINVKTWPSNLKYMEDYTEALFTILDLDNDGSISKHDFVNAHGNYDDLEARLAGWNLITKNNDSAKLDRNQFNELCIEFLVSLNSQDRGNWIFGKFEH
jgi:Ca2+-binding EF-hand superfamily protein